VADSLLQIGPRPPLVSQFPPRERARLERRARLLAWGGNGWHVIEFAIAVGAGLAAGSVALIGFGVDSVIVLAAYIGVESIRDLIGGHHPDPSWVGIGLAAFTAPTMPLLAMAKRRVGHMLNSSATVSEAQQNQICAYLSIALLIGLLANALAGWWWADPAAALVIGAVAVREGIESWQGQRCDCC
jgi:hypothetical protein